MGQRIEVKVPDIGDFKDVPVIELLVRPGERVAKDQGLVTLESDKATMEVPSPAAGVVAEIKVKLDDRVSEGHVIAILEPTDSAGQTLSADGERRSGTAASERGETLSPLPVLGEALPRQEPPATGIARGVHRHRTCHGQVLGAPAHPHEQGKGVTTPAAASPTGRKADVECAMVVLGAGPGGYSAAFRAADLGLDTVLIERFPTLGGVCLNVGCIPSKALLHAAAVIDEAAHAADYGVDFGQPRIVLDTLRGYKDKVVGQLTKGLTGMARQRKVRVLQGTGRFVSPHEIEVAGEDGRKLVRFEQCIVAAGSQPVKLPGFPWDDPRIMDSTDALELAEIPGKLLVVGGGIIGLEMATIYRALGSTVTVVELMDQLMPGADADLVKPLADRLKKQGVAVHLKAKAAEVAANAHGIQVGFAGEGAPEAQQFDRVLVSVGRVPNGGLLDAGRAGVEVTERGFIPVDRQMRTNVPHIFAIGDLVGPPMLAHKATHEGRLAAEVAAGQGDPDKSPEWVARVIPSVAFTDPEIAWVGATENEARAQGLKVGIGKFPWAASGRAIGIGRTEGFTKLIFDEATDRILGAGIVGPHAGDLIAELGLAIEMGCEAADIGHTIHPHPTLSESVGMAAEVFEGTITDLYVPRKR